MTETPTIVTSNSSVYENTNGFPLSNGKTLHMDIGSRDIANRIITVGSSQRAEKIARFMRDTRTITSSRGFTTITGTYHGKEVSVVSIGMGAAMMDFFVRESRAILDGTVAIVRFGTCGGLAADAPPGNIVVATQGASFITRNPDAFKSNVSNGSSDIPPYRFHDISPSHEPLHRLVQFHLEKIIGREHVTTGINITADSFYSSQGRVDLDNFNDRNEHIVDDVISHYPNAKSMEMETFMLFHLSNCAKKSTYSTAAAIVVANRKSSKVIDSITLERMEDEGGEAILNAITDFELQ